MASLSLAFDILARDHASQEVDHVAKSLERASRAGSLFGSLAGGLISKGIGALGNAAVSAARGLEHLVSDGFGELEAYQKGFSQLASGIASTGGVAGASAGQLEKLAGAIQAYSGQTDDSIVASEQLLLTFTNIRNGAGATNDILNQTVKISADMAARFGGDASASAIQLGKALNDPVKGITALQRVGISFSEQQKKQINGFIEQGKVVSAQKVLLGELNKEIGGSAKAYGNTLPGQVAKAHRAFEDLEQGIAGALAPTLQKYLPQLVAGMGTLGPKIQAGVSRVAPVVAKITKVFFEFEKGFYSGFLAKVLPAFRQLRDAGERLGAGLSAIFGKGSVSAESFGKRIGGLASTVQSFVIRGLALLVDGVTKAIPAFERLGAKIADTSASVIGFVRSILSGFPPLLGAMSSVADALGFHGVAKNLDKAKAAIAGFGKDAEASLQGFADSARGAADSFDDAITRMAFAKQRAAQITADLSSDNPNVAARAAAAVAAASAAAAKKATGKVAAAVSGGYTVSMPKVAASAKKSGEAAGQALIDGLTSTFEAAKSRLQSLVSDSLSLRQQITSALQGGSALTDIFQGPDLNANGAFGKQNNFGRIRDFLQKRVAQERRFVLELRDLIRLGTDPSLVAQIAAAGVDGGQRIAEGLLSGGKSGIGQINSLERQIASLANTTGKTVADQHYARQIAEQRRTTEVLSHKLDVETAVLKRIEANTSGSGSAAASLRSHAATAGL